MFAKRNAFTLALIWVIILAAGLFWYFREGGRLEEIRKKERELQTQLQESQEQIKRLTQVESAHDEINEKWSHSPKRIISADEPSFTLSYLNWIMTSNNLDIFYDFVLNGKRENEDVTTFNYTLTGEGSYNDIYKMLWYLTYEPILYKIEQLTLNNTGDLLKFNMKLQGFTVDSSGAELQDDLGGLQRLSQTNGVARQRDIFEPLIKPKPVVRSAPKERPKPTLPPKQPGEIDVEKASLKAVTPNSVFIAEGNSGLKELKIGDPVYLGRLVGINQKRNEAEFLITKFGRTQRVVLKIDERK